MSKQIVDEADFRKEVLEVREPVLVDFYADWCGPCRAMMPVVDELADQLAGQVKVVKVNVDDASALAGRYEVQSIPNFVLIKNGQVLQRFVGQQPKQVLLQAIKAHLN